MESLAERLIYIAGTPVALPSGWMAEPVIWHQVGSSPTTALHLRSSCPDLAGTAGFTGRVELAPADAIHRRICGTCSRQHPLHQLAATRMAVIQLLELFEDLAGRSLGPASVWEQYLELVAIVAQLQALRVLSADIVDALDGWQARVEQARDAALTYGRARARLAPARFVLAHGAAVHGPTARALRHTLAVQTDALSVSAELSLVDAARTAWLLALRANQSPEDAAALVVREVGFSWPKATRSALSKDQIQVLLEKIVATWLERFTTALVDVAPPSVVRFHLPKLFFDTSELHRVHASDDQLDAQARHLAAVAYPAHLRDDLCVALVPRAVLKGVLVVTEPAQASDVQYLVVFGTIDPDEDVPAVLDRVAALDQATVDPAAVLLAARQLAAS